MGGLEARRSPHCRDTGEVLGDPRAEFLEHAVGLFLAVVPARSIVDLDQVDPARCRAFTIQDLIDQVRCRFVSVQPGKNGPGIQTEGQGLPGLFAAIFEQSRRHAATSEPSSQRAARSRAPHDDPVVNGLKGNVRTRPKTCAFAQILWDYHLALGANSLSHTASVYLTQFLM
jgi:hypothetical protein